jgi:hypothetical protein
MATVTETFVTTIDDATAVTHAISGVTIAAGKLGVLRFGFQSDSVTVVSVVDDAGNTWRIATSAHSVSGDNQTGVMAFLTVPAAGLSGATITITLSATATLAAHLAYFTSDVGWPVTALVLDKAISVNTGLVAPWSSGVAPVTAQADDLLVGMAYAGSATNGGSSTPSGSWIEENEQNLTHGYKLVTEWQHVTATGAYAATGTWSAAEIAVCCFAAFKTYVAPTARPDVVFSSPDSSSGVIPASAASAWGFGSRVEALGAWPFDVALTGISFEVDEVLAVDTTREVLIEIATGDPGSEVTKVQIPYSFRNDTAVGYYSQDHVEIFFPEPVVITAFTRLSVRIADSKTTANNYDAFKIFFREIAAVSSTPIAGSDSATGTENAVVVVSLAGSDVGAGSQNGALASAISGSDSGTDSETATVRFLVAVTDANGTVTETAAIAVPISGADVGSGSEIASILTTMFANDIATGDDTSTVLAAISGSDANASVVENAVYQYLFGVFDTNEPTVENAVLVYLVSGAESGSGSDSGSRVASYTGNDAGTGVNTGSLQAAESGSESATGSDGSLVIVRLSSAETGVGADSGGVLGGQMFLTGFDSAAGQEIASLVASTFGADSGLGIDAFSNLAKAGFDQASGSETSAIDRSFVVDDSGSGVESADITAIVQALENGIGEDTGLLALTVFKFGADFGVGSDFATVFEKIEAFVRSLLAAGFEKPQLVAAGIDESIIHSVIEADKGRLVSATEEIVEIPASMYEKPKLTGGR